MDTKIKMPDAIETDQSALEETSNPVTVPRIRVSEQRPTFRDLLSRTPTWNAEFIQMKPIQATRLDVTADALILDGDSIPMSQDARDSPVRKGICPRCFSVLSSPAEAREDHAAEAAITYSRNE